MKELHTWIHILRLKPIDFTRAIHQQISPKYLARRKHRRIAFNLMFKQVKVSVRSMKALGISLSEGMKAIRMWNGAVGPYYKQYIEGIRLEYNRYYECVNSPLWR